MDDSGGYDANFIVPPPNELICPVCTCVVRDPIQIVGCGHRLCSACYASLKKFNNNCTCPTDRTVIRDDKVFPDVGADRTVLSLEVKCDYFKKGCVWVGELRDLQKHIENCFHQRIDGLVHLQDKVAKLETSLQQKNAEVNELKNRMENITLKMKNSSKEKDTEINGLKRLVEKLIEQTSSKMTEQKDTEVNGLKRLVEKLMKQIQTSSKALSAVEERLVSSLEQRDTEISNLQRVVNKIMNRFEIYTEQKDADISRLQGLLENVMKNLPLSAEQISKEITGFRGQLENFRKQLQSSTKSVASVDAKCTSSGMELTDLRSLLYYDTDRLDRCCKEIETIKDERRSTEIELGELREDLNKCTSNVQSLSELYDDKMTNVGELKGSIKGDGEIPDIRKSILTLENTIDNYHTEIKTLKNEFRDKHIDCSVKFEKTEEFLSVISNHVRSQERKMDSYLKSMEALQRFIPSDLHDQIIPKKYWCECVMKLNGRMDNLARIAHESLPNMDKRITLRDTRVQKNVKDMETLNKCYFLLYLVSNHFIDMRNHRYRSILAIMGSSLVYYFREPIYSYVKESIIDRYFPGPSVEYLNCTRIVAENSETRTWAEECERHGDVK